MHANPGTNQTQKTRFLVNLPTQGVTIPMVAFLSSIRPGAKTINSCLSGDPELIRIHPESVFYRFFVLPNTCMSGVSHMCVNT